MIHNSANLKNFAETLNSLMSEKNLNDSSLSKEVNIDRSTISQYRNGRNFPSVDNCIKLANLFEVSISYLLGETEIREADNKVIGERLGIDDETIKNLEKIKSINKTFDDKYKSFLTDVLVNIDLYKSLISTTNELMEYSLDANYQKQIDKQLNETKSKINPLIKKEKMKLEHYIDIIACQKFLEEYHIYLEKLQFENNPTNLSKKALEDRKGHLEKELKRVIERLKYYNQKP